MKVSELNFTEIKENIKNYLANNPDFTDYNFEGSGLSLLLDILAYNTYYNMFYMNMAINENFLGTAIKRGSLASIAKNFGYTPKGRTSARIKTVIEITEPVNSLQNGNKIILDKRTATFTVGSDNQQYTFTPVQSYTLESKNGKYNAEIELIEGVWVTQTYQAGLSKYIIPEFNIDLSTVEVYEVTQNNEFIPYTRFNNLKTLNSDSRIFYIFETPFQTYEILFGDGILGAVPSPGSTIQIYYKTSAGEAANDLSNIAYSGNLIDGRFGQQDINYLTIVPSYGGSEPEPLDSIRKNTLNAYYAQERAVTVNDYKYFLEKEYPLAQSVSVWGGQDNDPPIYGKVFISIRPKKGFTLSVSEKQRIINEIIKPRNVVTVIPEIVDPEYTFLVLDSTIKYDTRKTSMDAEQMKFSILETIEEFANDELGKFDTYFNYSKFITQINNINPAIIGNNTFILLKKYVTFIPNLTNTYKVNFKNEIKERSFKNLVPLKMETDTTINSELDIFLEDERGYVYAYTVNNVGEKIRRKVVGTVNYNTGNVELIMNVSGVTGRNDYTMSFIAEPKAFDVQMKYNDILIIDPTDISIRIVAQ